MVRVKRLLLLFIPLLLLCSACEKSPPKAEDSAQALYLRVCETFGGTGAFLIADSDFAKTNFEGCDGIDEALICFGEGGENREFGIFRVSTHRQAIALKERIRAYLSREQEALHSIAALYPAEELEEKLALYRDATIGIDGDTVYYFVMDPKDTTRALAALKQ